VVQRLYVARARTALIDRWHATPYALRCILHSPGLMSFWYARYDGGYKTKKAAVKSGSSPVSPRIATG
jgi:hypothetical protein